MCGKVAFRNIMNIVLVGVDTLINERTTQTYGILLEKTVHLSLEIFILVMERDLVLADVFRPLYQVFILSYYVNVLVFVGHFSLNSLFSVIL
jgi:nuclear pore complex protein Nup205